MAEAAEQYRPIYNWSPDETFRHLTRTVRLSDSDALYEMEQLRVEVQKYIDAKPQGDPEYLYKNFRLRRDRHGVVVEGIRWDSRCKFAEQDVRAIRPSPAVQSLQNKPEAEDGWQVRRVKEVLREILFPPDGRPPADTTVKAVQKDINEIFTAWDWKLASRDNVARAMGRRPA